MKAHLSTEQRWENIARKGRDSLLFFAQKILGYDKLKESVHGPWAERAEDFSQLRRLYLHPRNTYKTTTLTISFALWLLVQDREVVRGVRGRDLRILIGSDSTERARDMLREITQHIRFNEAFRRAYGNLYNPGGIWAAQQIVIPRNTRAKEPSIQTAGKGVQLTSAHYDIALMSDIVTFGDRDSPAERKRTVQWVRDLISLVELQGLVQFEGTRWAGEDLYGYIIDELNPALLAMGEKPYDVVVESVYNDNGEPRFPELGLDEKQLERLRLEKGDLDFAAQYENKPLPESSILFKEADLNFFDALPALAAFDIIGFCDPSLGKSATSDFSAIITLARHRESGEVFLVDADIVRRPVGVLRAAIVSKFVQFGGYAKFGMESNAFQDLLIDDVESDLKKESLPFRISRIHHSRDKVGRIQAAEPQIKAVLYPKNWREVCPELLNQLLLFPAGMFDDGPDSLAGCLSLIGKGYDQKALLRVFDINAQARPNRGSFGNPLSEVF